MKIFIASDHGGIDQKNSLVPFLKELGHEVIDLGTNTTDSCHYPEYASALAKQVVKNQARGILVCGSGIGVSVVANKYKGITAALCRTLDDARLSREHNNSNVICFGGRTSTQEEIEEMTRVWLSTDFEGGRHKTRTDMFANLGSEIE